MWDKLVIVGSLLFYGSGIAMFVFWVMAMTEWIGMVGTVLGVVFFPAILIFPVIYFFVTGLFIPLYFIVWASGILGAFLMNYASNKS